MTSLKIEGRKKSPLYVAAATALYRGVLDGTLDPERRREREEDVRAIFSRPWTALGLRRAPRGDAIDPEWTGHRGAPIGEVETIVRAEREGHRLRFTAGRGLELHDGLQIDLPGQTKPFGFGIKALWQPRPGGRSRSVVEAPAGAVVEVELPAHHPNIPKGARIYCASSQAVKRRYRFELPKPGLHTVRHPIALTLELSPERARLAGAVLDERGRPRAEAAIEELMPLAAARGDSGGCRKALERLGDTPFSLSRLTVVDPDGLFVPLSVLNAMRRGLCAELERRLADQRAARAAAVLADIAREVRERSGPGAGGRRWCLKLDDTRLAAQLGPDLADFSEVTIEIGSGSDFAEESAALAAFVPRERLRFALPAVARRHEAARLEKSVAALCAIGFRRFEAGNLGAFGMLRNREEAALDISADWSCYALNRAAVLQLLEIGASRITLSPESDRDSLRELAQSFPGRLQAVVFQDTPLFISESCPYAARFGCPGKEGCRYEELELEGRDGGVTAINRDCRTYVVSGKAYSLAHRLSELPAEALSFRVDFLLKRYSPEAARCILRSIRAGSPLPAVHAGNFERGLQ